MTASPALLEALNELARETGEIESDPDFRGMNDPKWGQRARAAVALSKKVLARHLPNPSPDLVHGLEILGRGVRLLRVPVREEGEDPDDRSRAFDTLRAAVGRMRTALDDALDAARTEWPDIEPIPRQTVPLDLDRVRALLVELDAFEDSVRRLARDEASAPGFDQQGELLRFFAGDMDLELDLARFVLRVNDVTLDLGAVAATVEAARDATNRFRDNVRDWFGRVTDGLLSGAEALTVTQIVAGVRALGRAIGAGGQGLPEMILIQPGAFIMGIPETESETEGGPWDNTARPLHRVWIQRPFLMGKYPVTHAEYFEFVLEFGRTWAELGDPHRHQHPAMNVSWDDAVAYAAWLSGRTGHHYRLPSEAEWEYACRAGTTTARWWGDKLDRTKGNFHSPRMTAVDANGPNPWGLHDMLGNAGEWVADRWHDDYNGAPADGTAWTDGNDPSRVLRGGSWNDSNGSVRTGIRVGDPSGAAHPFVGFRLARTL